MIRTLIVAAAVTMTFGLGAARADDAKMCDDGITMIKAEAAKNPPQAVADKLKTSLRVAEREKGEKEYDECLDAVADAKKAVGSK